MLGWVPSQIVKCTKTHEMRPLTHHHAIAENQLAETSECSIHDNGGITQGLCSTLYEVKRGSLNAIVPESSAERDRCRAEGIFCRKAPCDPPAAMCCHMVRTHTSLCQRQPHLEPHLVLLDGCDNVSAALEKKGWVKPLHEACTRRNAAAQPDTWCRTVCRCRRI